MKQKKKPGKVIRVDVEFARKLQEMAKKQGKSLRRITKELRKNMRKSGDMGLI